jgi:hypothetical protein
MQPVMGASGERSGLNNTPNQSICFVLSASSIHIGISGISRCIGTRKNSLLPSFRYTPAELNANVAAATTLIYLWYGARLLCLDNSKISYYPLSPMWLEGAVGRKFLKSTFLITPAVAMLQLSAVTSEIS